MQRGSPRRLGEGLLFFYFSFCSVARWGATFCSFRGIGEGGTASPRGSWSRGGGPCGPRYAGAPPRAPGDFRFTTKVTKGVPGALPLDPVGGHYHPPSSAPRCSPQKGEGAIDADGFATLRWCGQLAAPFPLASTKRKILLLIRGLVGRMVARLDATLGAIRGIGEGERF